MKFTIGLPITKTDFLKQTLESISCQSQNDFELIIRNNGETDYIKSEIKNICSSWIDHENVKYFESEKQLKIFDNFNEILSNSTGEYLVILSDDDIISATFLEDFDTLIQKYPQLDLFHCRVHLINEVGQIVNISPICPQFETSQDFIYHRLKGFRLQFLSDFVVKTNSLKAIGGFPILPHGWGLDDLTWIKLSTKGVAYTNHCGLQYRILKANFSWKITNYSSRFADNKFLYNEIQKIINANNFIDNSEYSFEIFQSASIRWYRKSNRYTLNQILHTNNLLNSFIIFLKNKKKYHLYYSDFIYAFVLIIK